MTRQESLLGILQKMKAMTNQNVKAQVCGHVGELIGGQALSLDILNGVDVGSIGESIEYRSVLRLIQGLRRQDFGGQSDRVGLALETSGSIRIGQVEIKAVLQGLLWCWLVHVITTPVPSE